MEPRSETRRSVPAVYHINGYIPREEIRRRSETVTLTEDAFADVMLSTNSIASEFINTKFATNTFLILGSSLSDGSLKNMLRGAAKRNAANHHYIVYWEDRAKPRTQRQREDISAVNLSVYNLISIFLGSEELRVRSASRVPPIGRFARMALGVSMEAIVVKSALVLFSGGQDSTTCLAWALSKFDRVGTVGFDYGQRHAVELEVRQAVLEHISLEFAAWRPKLDFDHVIRLDLIRELGR